MPIQTTGVIDIVIVPLPPNRHSGVLLAAQVPLTPTGPRIAAAQPPHYHRVLIRAIIRGTTATTPRAGKYATAHRPRQTPHQLVRSRLYES